MIPANTDPHVEYIGNGTAAAFAYAFPTFESSNIKVQVQDTTGTKTLLTLSTDYTLDGVGRLRGGGSVNLVDAGQAWLDGDGDLDTGYTLLVDYVPLYKQLQKFSDLGPHGPAAFERGLDRLTMDLIALADLITDDLLTDGYEPTGPEVIAAGGTVTVTQIKRQHRRITCTGGAKALSTTPFGTDPDLFRDGMVIVVEGSEVANYLTLAEADIAYGYVGNGGIAFRKGTLVAFCYNATDERFYLMSTGAW